MTMDEAIKLLDRLRGESYEKGYIEDAQALSLGIEALNGIKKVRKTLEPYVTALLLGEIWT